MKLRKLTIHNMASIGDASIDFAASPLSDCEVFLISGKTGAGKSTILDCICLALYATAPRFKNTRINGTTPDGKNNAAINVSDPRQILRRNTGEGFTELEFSGNNGISYRARWCVQRSRKKPSGKLQKKVWTLENLDNDLVLTKDGEIQQEITQAVGLDFNQFCRTVMLAQGEFTRFLNSNDNDKSEILSKITGTEIYSRIGVKIYERFKSEENAFNTIKIKIDNMPVLSDESVEEKKTLLSSIIEETEKLRAAARSETELLNLLKNEIESSGEIKRLEMKLPELESDFASILLSRESAADEIRNLESELKNLQHEIDLENDNKPIYESSQEIVNNIRNIAVLELKISDERAQISALNEQLEKSITPDKESIEKKLSDIQQVIEARDEETKKLHHEIESLGLQALRKEKDDMLNRRISLQNLAILIKNYRDAIKRTEQEKERLAAQETMLDELRKKREFLSKPLNFATEKLNVCRQVYDKLFASSEKILRSIRSTLVVGDTCPVCRRKIVEDLPSDAAIKSIIDEQKTELENAERDKTRLDDEIRILDAEIRSLSSTIDNNRKRLNEDNSCEEALQKAEDASIAAGIGSIDDNTETRIIACVENLTKHFNEISGIIASGEKLEVEAKAMEKSLRELILSSQKEKDKLADANLKIEKTKTKISGSKSNIKSYERERSEQADKVNKMLTGTKYDVGYGQNPADLCSRLESDSKKYSEKLRKKDNLNNIIENKTTALSNLDSTVKAIASRLPSTNGNRNVSPLKTEDLQKFASNLLAETTSTIEQMSKEKQKMESVRLRIGQLCKDREDVTIESIQTNIIGINDKIRNNDMNSGAIDNELKLDREQRTKREALLLDYEQQGKTLEKWHILYNMFGDSEGKKFRKIAQSFILSELIHAANHYMKGFSDRYKLRVEPGTFVIQVEDAWQGYTLRSASTISGGESFLVSLSLALALSDIGSSFSVDTLFIDEGFGSLSGDVLQNAISTLRILHSKSGRKVGIISHVEELRDRIPVQINVNSEGLSAESRIFIM